MTTVVLATVGTLGDLHPFLALGQALQARGHRAIIAGPGDHAAHATRAGIEAVTISPDYDTICARIGGDKADVTARIIASQRRLFEELIFRDLSASVRRLSRVCANADAIVASTFVPAAAIVAERRRVPLISAVLQPMALLSPHDPPRTPDFRLLRKAPASRVGAGWNRLALAAMRRGVHHLYGRAIDAARAEHGLRPAGGSHLFDPHRAAALPLCLYSSHFAPLPPDAPPRALAVGFPLYDGGGALDPALARFLAAGPPPLVFTLGSFAVHAARPFYREAARVARQLAHRAVLLTGDDMLDSDDQDVIALTYAPHSRLLPHAAAVIHHGGIGTTGQALLAGKPQLVLPHMGDQHDHARRVERLGVGRHMDPARFTVDQAAPVLAALLADTGVAERADALAHRIRGEDAMTAAATAIEQELGSRAECRLRSAA